MKKALNKIYFVIDTEREKTQGFNRAIISKPYQTISVPRELCAKKNRIEAEYLGKDISYRYAIVEIPLMKPEEGYKYYFEKINKEVKYIPSLDKEKEVISIDIKEVIPNENC